MAAAREGTRIASALRYSQLPATLAPCARRWASTNANSSPSLADLESTTAFTAPEPDQNIRQAFDAARSPEKGAQKLPGNRYQYHPPKYYRGPLHPIQMPPSSDPTARDFVPGPLNFPRLKHTYDSTIAPDLMTLSYAHIPPGSAPSESQKGTLRQWDDSSPYHKNRPSRGPRGGGSSRLGILERKITWNNIPEIEAVTVNCFSPGASGNKEYLHVALAALQAITGRHPEVSTIKRGTAQWHTRAGDKAGARVTLRGPQAYEFVDKLVTLVLPKIKDWPGVKGSTGDDAGNLALGMEPSWMAYFPEIEFNYDMYPPKLMPGCHIFIHTTATSDRQARLLLQALGFPFYGKATH
ncbi:hypothetical protein HIM_06422 [Hirsutella minnesotensis 3608]|uniref:Ribosomal protein L5 C-terminal domain-containing protein n=1 Tax=Hirsutella minnesotensis 3608 TaxID=1043627 RepID=A0A0F7ZJ72_9HYPO|nr:hypothetical protein HIM_06422 [Hirsutella minnesotensis 3608]